MRRGGAAGVSVRHRSAARVGRAAGGAEPLEPRRLMAATPELVADVNQTSDVLGPFSLTTAGAVAYFTGQPPA